MDLLLAVGVFFVVALIFPLIRHRLRTGQWAIVVHRAADPFQAYVGRAFGGTLVGILAWASAYAALGPDRLHVLAGSAATKGAGWALFGAALLLVVLAQAQMGRSWRIGIDDRPTGLVVDGVYRWVRHPIYTGMMGLALSLVLLAPSPWTCMFVPLIGFQMGVQARLEEQHLLRQHGEAFASWAATSGRFLPRLAGGAP